MEKEQTSSVFKGMDPKDGFHEIDQDMLGPFVWSEKRFDLKKTCGIPTKL